MLINWLKEVFQHSDVPGAISLTLRMALASTFFSSVLGVLAGLWLERVNFRGKKLIVRLNRTLMAVPPVVIGLLVYLLLMRRGPLGFMNLLFSFWGMVLAQSLIITPIVCGMSYAHALRLAPEVRAFAKSMGASPRQGRRLLISEMRHELYFVVITAFGRSISEVGAVMLVGGNIKGSTRTMTTTIALLKSQGIFYEGIFLGVLLLLAAFILQSLADYFQKQEAADENF